MTYKYYYNNQLIRTSKSRDDYKYALLKIREDGTYIVFRCSAKYELCQKDLEHYTKAETIANQLGITIKEVWEKGNLWSSQLHSRKDFIIAELVRA